MPRRPRAILGLLGAAAVLAGCGEAAPVRDRDGVLHLRLDEYRIRPVSIRVHAGAVRIVALDVGRLTHNVRLEAVDEAEGAAPQVLGGTPTAQPGETVRSKDPIVLRPGKYRLVCSIGNHENLGQYATLEVVAAGN